MREQSCHKSKILPVCSRWEYSGRDMLRRYGRETRYADIVGSGNATDDRLFRIVRDVRGRE